MRKLFIVSNRLPVTVENKDGVNQLRRSSGGLVSAISAYLKQIDSSEYDEVAWVGVPGCTEKTWNDLTTKTDSTDYTYSPLFVNWKKYEMYYNGFSNSLLWPLFHYFPSYADYNDAYFQAYVEVNQQFADLLSKQVKNGDIVWIHDYHLLPLAGMLRKLFPGLTIGFFLHIPFPSFELFRVLPRTWQKGILTGMLGADLLGFHTADYADYFLSSVERVLNVAHDGQNIVWNGRQIKVDAFPISIDYEQFNNAYFNEGVSTERYINKNQCGNKKMIFSVDRLDYTKGISNRLKGYEQFLVDHPEYMGKVVFVLVIVPSRDGIAKYAERKRMIDEYIGSLNSRLGNISWQPVIYQYAHLSFDELLGLYTACDIALITPVRDGMNLVAKEFVASRYDKQGVLILSEMTGAAAELSDALLINPNDIKEISSMILSALTMSSAEQADRMTKMQERISRYNVVEWSADFFAELNQVKTFQREREVRLLDDHVRLELIRDYSSSLKRLLLLDYDGTLSPFFKVPSEASPSEDLLLLLKEFTTDTLNDVFIISGRDSDTLDAWFGHLPLNLVAEHGARVKLKGGDWVSFIDKDLLSNSHIEKMIEDLAQRTPRSFVEKKKYSIAWHYRDVDLALGTIRARELFEQLRRRTEGLPFTVLNGNKVIEIKPDVVNKGIAVERILKAGGYDFVLCLGDDTTDEDMFRALSGSAHAYSVKVGMERSNAKFNIHSTDEVISLLENILLHSDGVVQLN